MSSPEAVLQIQSFACVSAPILHPVEMPKSPDPCRMSISTNLRDPSAVICQPPRTLPSPESSRDLVKAVVPKLQLGLPVPKSPLVCLCRSSVFLCLLCFALLRSQTDSLGSTNIPCSSGLSYHSANKQRPCWDSDSDSGFDLCLLSCRPCRHLSLSCLSCRHRHHIHWISSVLYSDCRPQFRSEPNRT